MSQGLTREGSARAERRLRTYRRAIASAALMLLTVVGVQAAPIESPRMQRAKDYIADEHWARAIEELKAAVADPRESSRDEALFWLAHSHHQAGDAAAALEAVQRLEREHAKSRWVRPARSLRLEIAQRLRRRDVLWLNAVPPDPPGPPPTPVAVQPVPAPDAIEAPPAPHLETPRPPRGSRRSPASTAPQPTAAVPPTPPPTVVPIGEPHATAPASPPTPRPGIIWVPEHYSPDTDLRIQALGSLIRTDADKVIPILKAIALESHNTGQARRALFVLASSGRPDARRTVVEVAKIGSEAVRIAAVRELGRIRGAAIANELLQVYSTANNRVKDQVVVALGERAETSALTRIIRSETNRYVREKAIVTLGRAGGRAELRALYDKASAALKRPIIIGLFNARAEEELMAIAERERDAALRGEVLHRLRLLGTPAARAYLERRRDR